MTEVGRDLVVAACAVSAGIHSALAPQHLEDGVAAGFGFALSAALLAALACALARNPTDRVLDAAIVVFGGLLGAYALAATTGIPVLHPDPEPVDRLAVATKAIEALGLLAALNLKGTLTWTTRARIARFRSH